MRLKPTLIALAAVAALQAFRTKSGKVILLTNAPRPKSSVVKQLDGMGVPRDVCRVTAEASPRPVYLRPNKNAAPELWVRTGNSTRQLPVDAASEYVMHRWPLGPAAGIAAQFRAAMRFSQGR